MRKTICLLFVCAVACLISSVLWPASAGGSNEGRDARPEAGTEVRAEREGMSPSQPAGESDETPDPIGPAAHREPRRGVRALGDEQTLTWPGHGALVVVKPATLIFGPVKKGAAVRRAVKVRNGGDSDLIVRRVEVEGRNGTEFEVANHCDGPLAGTRGCIVTVRLVARTYGRKSAQLHIHSNGTAKDAVVPLSGNVAPPRPVAVPETIDFGTVRTGMGATKGLLLRNVGLSDLVSSIRVRGRDTADYAVRGECGTLETGSECRIEVSFTPSAKGKRTAQIEVANDDNASPRRRPLVVKLSGRAK